MALDQLEMLSVAGAPVLLLGGSSERGLLGTGLQNKQTQGLCTKRTQGHIRISQGT